MAKTDEVNLEDIWLHVVYIHTHNLEKNTSISLCIVIVIVLVLFGCYRWSIVGGAVVVQYCWWCGVVV